MSTVKYRVDEVVDAINKHVSNKIYPSIEDFREGYIQLSDGSTMHDLKESNRYRCHVGDESLLVTVFRSRPYEHHDVDMLEVHVGPLIEGGNPRWNRLDSAQDLYMEVIALDLKSNCRTVGIATGPLIHSEIDEWVCYYPILKDWIITLSFAIFDPWSHG